MSQVVPNMLSMCTDDIKANMAYGFISAWLLAKCLRSRDSRRMPHAKLKLGAFPCAFKTSNLLKTHFWQTPQHTCSVVFISHRQK